MRRRHAPPSMLLAKLAAQRRPMFSIKPKCQLNCMKPGAMPICGARPVSQWAELADMTSIWEMAKALKQGGTRGAEANKSLIEHQGKGVAEALIKQAEAGDIAVRESMLKILADRGEVEALPLFRTAVNDPDAKIRRAALKTLATLGTQEDLSRLLEMLASA